MDFITVQLQNTKIIFNNSIHLGSKAGGRNIREAVKLKYSISGMKRLSQCQRSAYTTDCTESSKYFENY